MDGLLVETHALRRDFGTNRAVDALDLHVARGEVVGLLGHNGAGKTTTVRLLAGVLAPTAGTARVFGFDPTVDGVEVRRRVGVSTETPAVDDRLTGRQGLRAFADLYGVAPSLVDGRVADLLASFDLSEAADRRVGTYSKGMRQRLALARALLHDPALLFLDEPTAGLDPVAARAVADRVRALRAEGRGIVLCTHDLNQAQALCDRVVVLEHGAVVAEGAPSELAAGLGAGTRVRVVARPPVDGGGLVASLAATLATVDGWGDVDDDAPPEHAGVVVVHAVVRDADAIADGVAALVGLGARIHAVEREVPSLEDVYFALHRVGRGAVAVPAAGGVPA